MYTEKILARNNKPRAPSPTKKPQNTGNASTSGSNPKKSSPNKRLPNKSGKRNQAGALGQKGCSNKMFLSRPNKRQDLMKQLTDPTKIVKQLKN